MSGSPSPAASPRAHVPKPQVRGGMRRARVANHLVQSPDEPLFECVLSFTIVLVHASPSREKRAPRPRLVVFVVRTREKRRAEVRPSRTSSLRLSLEALGALQPGEGRAAPLEPRLHPVPAPPQASRRRLRRSRQVPAGAGAECEWRPPSSGRRPLPNDRGRCCPGCPLLYTAV